MFRLTECLKKEILKGETGGLERKHAPTRLKNLRHESLCFRVPTVDEQPFIEYLHVVEDSTQASQAFLGQAFQHQLDLRD